MRQDLGSIPSVSTFCFMPSCRLAGMQDLRSTHRSQITAVGFEPTPLRTGAWSQRLRPLGQTVTCTHVTEIAIRLETLHLQGLRKSLAPGASALDQSRPACHVISPCHRPSIPRLRSEPERGAAGRKSRASTATRHRHRAWRRAAIATCGRVVGHSARHLCTAAADSCGVRTHALADWRLEPAP